MKKTMEQPLPEAGLQRKLSPLSVWALAFGCIIGWGAFMMPGTTFLPTAGTMGTTIAMIIGALVMITISFSYSYMIPKYPKAGGEFTFTKAAFGPKNAFVCAWYLALAYLANVPMDAVALGVMTRKLFFGVFQFGRLYSIAGYDIYLGEVLLASGVMIIMAVFSVCGVKKSGFVQTVMAVSLAVTFLIIVMSALFSPITDWANLKPFWGPSSHATPPEIRNGILALVAVAPWAYVGFDTIPQASEEFNFPVKKVNAIMIIAIFFGCVVYVCNNLVTAAASPDWTVFIQQHDWAVGAAVEALMGKTGLVILGIASSCAILSGVLGFLLATSRLLYSLALDGCIPAVFGRLHPKYQTPANAIWFCLIASLIGPWLGRTALGWFVDMSAIGGAIGYGYTCSSAFITLKREKDLKRRMPLGVMTILGALFSLTFIFLLLVPGMPGSLSWQSYIMLGVWTVCGLIFYGSKIKRKRLG
ncbi:MAG: APC family permease [Oscillibacter sp.]|nr:APC family permease [Oscillibacter sp.]